MLLQQTRMSNPVYLEEVRDVDGVADEGVVQVLVLGDQNADQDAADACDGEVRTEH